MGHYDSSRPGYCGGCGAAPGNMNPDGSCPFCAPRQKLLQEHRQKMALTKPVDKPRKGGTPFLTEVDLAEAELRLLAKPFQTPPAVLITSDGAVWGRVSDEQVLVLLEQAVVEVKRRNGWQS